MTAKPSHSTPKLPTNSGGWISVVVLAGFAIGLFFLLRDTRSSTNGEISVRGSSRGDFRLVPSDCSSMGPFGRFGANLHGKLPNDGAVYVTSDPILGPEVTLELPGSCRNDNGTDCETVPVSRQECRRFEVKVEPTGVIFNDVRLVRGHARLDCGLANGAVIRGEVHFDGC